MPDAAEASGQQNHDTDHGDVAISICGNHFADPEADEDNEELWTLYLRAAALRIKVDEEATILATAMAAGVRPDGDLLARAKESLDSAKELDERFGEFLDEAVYYSNPKILHQLYRSRFRLLRGFSGLWLIYDHH